MTKQLAAEGAPHGIRVNCVSPGMIATPATSADLLASDHPMRDIARHIPLGRIGTSDEVAACALFLASDEAGYVTGAKSDGRRRLVSRTTRLAPPVTAPGQPGQWLSGRPSATAPVPKHRFAIAAPMLENARC